MTIPATAPSRPIVRYHGGKWMLAPWIISHFPSHQVYTEAFGGGASILLRKPRVHTEVYNDLDSEIVNLFRVARNHGEELCRSLALTPYAREEFELSYNSSDDPLEQARRTVLRAFLGHGGDSCSGIWKTGFRANAKQQGTNPAKDWANYPENLMTIINRLRGTVIENRHAFEVLQMHDSPQTLHYVDPPYVLSTRGRRRGYKYEMTDGEHVELYQLLKTLKGAVIVSGYPSDLYDNLYGDWVRKERITLADGAEKRMEVLWMRGNYAHPELFEITA